jgi:hypothetical protein
MIHSRLTGLADPLGVSKLDKWFLYRVVRAVDLANHTFAQLRIGHRVRLVLTMSLAVRDGTVAVLQTGAV